MAPTYPESMITRRFPSTHFTASTMCPKSTPLPTASGARPREWKRVWTLDELRAMPQESQITRHICIEGWSAIGRWAACPSPIS